MRVTGPGALIVLGLLITGCGELDYYAHLARGQIRVLWDQRPIAEVIGDPSTSEHVRQRLAFVTAVRAFADSLGLPARQQFTRFYDTGGAPVAWNVSASPPDSFAAYLWRFPLVGALPYKGFFERSRAIAERDRLRAAGYDALARSVSAYSTLGWLPDPVLSPMLEHSDDGLADLMLHELTHAAVYVEDHTDYNESVATFVGHAGALQYLQRRYGVESAPVREALSARHLARRFTDFVQGATVRFDSLYGLGLPRDEVLRRREALFEEIKADYRAQRADLGAGRYDGFLDWEMNNARLLSYRRYHRSLDRFEAVLARHHGDLAAALRVFVACGDQDDPWACVEAANEDSEPPTL